MILKKALLLMSALSLTAVIIGCQVDNSAFPTEFLQYPVNLTQDKEPQGFQKWDWGITPDSAFWSGRSANKSLAAYREKNPQWIIKRKSGVEIFSINLLPPEYSTAFGTDFNSVHLIFHPEKGLIGWDRIIYHRNQNSGESDMDSLHHSLLGTLTAKYGVPHLLPSRETDASTIISDVALWRTETISLTLTQYSYINNQSKIYLKAHLHKR
ncbi:MAG: hypothetical protein HN757_02755 [Calditrichaeota bacterium]|jgi:hypothetical protein|nr:hypothetical protein [Calditrichota bacterium]